jgi:hypothetical protein
LQLDDFLGEISGKIIKIQEKYEHDNNFGKKMRLNF